MATYQYVTNAAKEVVLDREMAEHPGVGTKQNLFDNNTDAWLRALKDQQDNQDRTKLDDIVRLATQAAKQSAKTTLLNSIAHPNVTNPGDRTTPVNTVVSLQVVASDPDSTPLQYAATGLPPALSINPDTGLISGTITTVTGSPFLTQIRVRKLNEPTLDTTAQFFWTITP